MAMIKVKKADGSWELMQDRTAIRYEAQELSNEEKAQARANIDAVSQSELTAAAGESSQAVLDLSNQLYDPAYGTETGMSIRYIAGQVIDSEAVSLNKGTRKNDLDFIYSDGSWNISPMGNYYGSVDTAIIVAGYEITDWIIKGVELADGGYKQILISGDIELSRNTNEDMSWTEWNTKTTVLVGGNPVQTFDADTKLSKPTKDNNYSRIPFVRYGEDTFRYKTLGTTIAQGMKNGWVPQYNPANRENNVIPDGQLVTGTPQYDGDAANKKYVDDTVAAMGDTKYDKIAVSNNYDRIPFISVGSANLTTKVYAGTVAASYSGTIPGYNTAGRNVEGAMPSGHLVTGIPEYGCDATNKKYVDDNFVSKNGDSAINGNLSIIGDLHIAGTTYTEDAQTIRLADNIIELNSTKQDNSTLLSGLAINKNATSTYGVMYDPTDDTVKFGEGSTEDGVFTFGVDEGAPLAVRDDSSNIADGAIMIFDKSKNRLVDSGYTIDGFKQWVREYIEAYMSTEMVISNNSAGGETLDINTDNYTEENGTLTIGG